MYPNHYFLEKSMEQHNKSLERSARKGWWSNRNTSAENKRSPSPDKEAPAAHTGASCTGKDQGICCQAYAPCQVK